METFDLLYKFRSEIIALLRSSFNNTIKEKQISSMFERWYMIAIAKGEKSYFIPVTFKAKYDDLDFYKNELTISRTILKREIKKIWNKYKDNKCYFSSSSSELSTRKFPRLEKLHSRDKKHFYNDVDILFKANVFIGLGSRNGSSNHLSVPPILFKNLKITELFGSPLNTSQEYCSLFSFEKGRFSSNGQFFDYSLKPGSYVLNPPFDEYIMHKAAKKVLKEMKRIKDVNVLFIIPGWDKKTMKEYRNCEPDKEFVAYQELTSSRFFRKISTLDKDYPFYNYSTEAYVNIPVFHAIVLSNELIEAFNLDDIVVEWKKIGNRHINEKAGNSSI